MHILDITYNLQYGVALDAFCETINPLRQYRMLKELDMTGVFESKLQQQQDCSQQIDALIAAATLSSMYP